MTDTKHLFSENITKEIDLIRSKFPKDKGKSAIIESLLIIQHDNNGFLNDELIASLANYLSIQKIDVYEVATFYSMYNLAPVGKNFIQVCTTTPCLLRGADKIVKLCKEKISPNENEVSKKSNSSWMEVECLGACVSAPMIQINDDYYEDLDEKSTTEILESLINNKPLKPGSYRGRRNTAPEKIGNSNGEKHA